MELDLGCLHSHLLLGFDEGTYCCQVSFFLFLVVKRGWLYKRQSSEQELPMDCFTFRRSVCSCRRINSSWLTFPVSVDGDRSLARKERLRTTQECWSQARAFRKLAMFSCKTFDHVLRAQQGNKQDYVRCCRSTCHCFGGKSLLGYFWLKRGFRISIGIYIDKKTKDRWSKCI